MSSQTPLFLSRTALLIQGLWKVFCAYRYNLYINAINVSADGEKVYVHTQPLDQHRSFSQFPSRLFPDVPSEIRAAIAAFGSCTESVSHMQELLHNILNGNVEFASVEINQTHDHCAFETILQPAGQSVMLPSHDIIGLALADGRTFAVDPSIAQYGFDKCILPMAEYQRQMGTSASRQRVYARGTCARRLRGMEAEYSRLFWLQWTAWHEAVKSSIDAYRKEHEGRMREVIFSESESDDVFLEELRECLVHANKTMDTEFKKIYHPDKMARRASDAASRPQVSVVVLFLCVVVPVIWFVSCPAWQRFELISISNECATTRVGR